ncbi:UDP-3-O-(3-hydroxymyristoyl)glucosamine N-acyltransferase [Pusillimonas sp. CC-YST705]|uniref:UDP-3-O-acylglucosamine N-acyltransferase n=1 Tax=Mesopusillimonas faecipullorum TaxID=2755040 RepID=A0ABS8CAQ4_9BURK|nr:UDP-3-O-(3-hydroxymyristoyl)glucosamine N-acyltransferase [Mesopusillimonas faecipullorum]MCB5363111.1 UDP-3-O-(3-hydroxymyristoyl)glucosamine N-acyltransferase [Mesopusillimonas faecipullorum]
MPVLLAPPEAPLLPELLREANVVGLDCEIAAFHEPMPRIRGLGSLLHAGETEISFLANPKLADQLAQCRAAAVILTPEAWQTLSDTPPTWHVVLCSQPYLMYALLAQWFDRHRIANLPTGIHPSAVIHESARIEAGVSIGPHCVIEAGAVIAAGTRLGPACIVGAGSVIGADSLLHARVTLYHGVHIGARSILHSGVVLGADGFGFAPMPGEQAGAWAKIAQIGGLVIGDDVEIGANTTVDRGALDDTRIGNGVKLDNQIMVAHNVVIGDHTAMAACVGVAGSTQIGSRCTIGGASMISGHLVLADDVHVSGGTAITSNVSKPGRYTGVFPFGEHRDWQRNAAVLPQLAQLRRRLRRLEDAGPAAGQAKDS